MQVSANRCHPNESTNIREFLGIAGARIVMAISKMNDNPTTASSLEEQCSINSTIELQINYLLKLEYSLVCFFYRILSHLLPVVVGLVLHNPNTTKNTVVVIASWRRVISVYPYLLQAKRGTGWP